MTDTNFNRRDFLKGVTVGSLGLALAAEEIAAVAQTGAAAKKPAPPTIGCAVIGLGQQGRDILTSLAKIGAPVVAVCDTYTAPAYVKRATSIVTPAPVVVDDYRKVLSNPKVQAVFVATPSNAHKQIVLDAIQAGKHVYCEAPLANTIEDAKAIAQAGAAAKTVFQAGLQYRSNKMHNHVFQFIKSGTLGTLATARGQYHKKQTWRRPASTPERERAMSWRMYKDSSTGIPGEIGIHQFDAATRYILSATGSVSKGVVGPVSVVGFGSNHKMAGYDAMEVPDTIQCVIEYPNGVRFSYDATLLNSYDGTYDTYNGSECAMLLRELRAWMFKETDSKLLGWEVYAKKDKGIFGDDTGIALVADATKLIALGIDPAKQGADVTKTPLYQAVDSFLAAATKNGKPDATALDGYRATVIGIKAHEAIMTGNKVTFQKEWFDL